MARTKDALAGYRRPRWSIRQVNGFDIRNRYPDWDVVETYFSVDDALAPFVPRGEAWIDRRFWRERDHLLDVHWREQMLHKRGWPPSRIRSYLKTRLTKAGPAPEFVVRTRQQDGLKICYVRGDIVRAYIDPGFIFGGHDLVYRDYIPAGEVWIDIRQDAREIKYTLFHELFERRLMARGLRYTRAHELATEAEKKLRSKELRKPQPLKIKAFGQKADFCGPAALRIVANYFGNKKAENDLGELCGTKVPDGTEHAGLIQGAKAIGAAVFTKDSGSLNELRHFIHKQRLPVIVGWWSGPDYTREEVLGNRELDQGHFSAVYHLTSRYIYLMDPETETGQRKITLQKFLAKWWDLDTPEYNRVDRWYLVINFDRKTFKVPGGSNH